MSGHARLTILREVRGLSMSWWELFRQATHERSENAPQNRELVASGSVKAPSVSGKHTTPTWTENRDYLAARRYWNRSSH